MAAGSTGGLPSTPQTGTGLTTPLLSVDAYRFLTGDQVSPPTTVTTAITDALTMLQRRMERTLGYGQYVEDLYLYKNGMVFPSATPIDGSKLITSGGNLYTPTKTVTTAGGDQGSIIQGAGIWVGWFTPLPWMPVWTGVIPPQTIVKYWGGFQPYGVTTGPTKGLPSELARLISAVAYYILHPIMVSPLGSKSSSIGGIATSGSLSSLMTEEPNVRRLVNRWRRPQWHPWQH